MKNKVAFCTLLLLFYIQVKSQAPLETMIHLDKSFYVSGEVMWYKLYLPSNWAEHNGVVRVSLVSPDSRVVDQYFLQNKGDTFLQGHLKIPHDIEPSYYQLQFNTVDQGFNSYGLGYFNVPIYSDFYDYSSATVVETESKENMPIESDLSVDLSIAKSTGSRPQMSIKIEVRDASGNAVEGHASVSVTNVDLTGSGSANILRKSVSSELRPDQLLDQIYVEGFLTDSEGDPLQVNVLGGYINKDKSIYYGKSQANGRFVMSLSPFTGKKNIQFVGFQYEQPEITSTLLKPTFIGDVPSLSYTLEVTKYLDLSRLRKKIYQYYDTLEQSLVIEHITADVNMLRPTVSYNVKDYESFKDIKSFFGELLTPLSFKMKRDSTFAASLYNPKGRIAKNTELNGPPLFIVDDKVTRNATYVAGLPISAVDKVDLFIEPKELRETFQAIGISGVVMLQTTLSNTNLPEQDENNVHTAVGFLPQTKYPSIQVQEQKANQPFFRSQLYWQADVVINEEGKAGVIFNHSDDIGNFMVEVVVQGKNGYRQITSKNYQVSF